MGKRLKITTCNLEVHRAFKELQIVTQTVLDSNKVKPIQLNRILQSLKTNGHNIEASVFGDKILVSRLGATNYEIYLNIK